MPDARDPLPAGPVGLLYHLARLQLPGVALAEGVFRSELNRAYGLWQAKTPGATPAAFLDGLYVLDWAVCAGCLAGVDEAWHALFAARTGRSDCLLVDALRARACRLYPRNEEKQESAVAEFWSLLLVPETDGGTAILARYDGQRPLAPWLIRVFQNWHLSKLRAGHGAVSLPDDDLAQPLPATGADDPHWHEAFCQAARDFLHALPDAERLLLGLRWRYRMTQREVATLLGVHEGTITRRIDKLRDAALEGIGSRLVAEGWTGDDLAGYVLTEMGGVLVDEPGLGADELRRLLAKQGKALPG